MRRHCLLFCLLPLFGASKAPACSVEPRPGPATATVRAAAVPDGGTIVLADGREVRLAPVAVPQRRWRGRRSIRPLRKLAMRARRRLAELVLDRDLMLAHFAAPDRYGRIRAQVFRADGHGAYTWIQGELVRAGFGRVEPEADTRQCVRALLKLEARARAGRRGIWRLRLFALRSVTDLRRNMASYQIVEGRVQNVAKVGGRIYLNFGKDWRKDFTVTVGRRAVRLFPENFWADKAHKRVRVRGWLERYHGPMIEATSPEQLEWLDGKSEEKGKPKK